MVQLLYVYIGTSPLQHLYSGDTNFGSETEKCQLRVCTSCGKPGKSWNFTISFQGLESHGILQFHFKAWKVMEFYNFISRPVKSWNLDMGKPGKSWNFTISFQGLESHGILQFHLKACKVMEFEYGSWKVKEND